MEITNFKKTELGEFPLTWSNENLMNISNFITKGATPTTYGYNWEKSGILFLRNECVSEKGLDLSKSMFISDDAHKILSRSEIRSNDILVTITGNVGRVILLREDFGFGNINQHIARVRISRNDISRNYVFHFISQKKYRKYFEKIITGQAYPQISLKQVREAVIYFPKTLTEQKAIADALTDVDELITNLEKLIAKKKAIKQGAMQQLLTPPHKGGKRLDGFSGDWVERNLGDCLKYEQPTKYIVKSTEYEEKSQVPVLTAGKSFLLGFTDENFGVYENLPVIIFDDFTTSSQFVNFKFKVKSSAMKMLTPTSQDFDINFIYALMNTIRYSLGDEHKRRWIAEFSKIKIYVPEIKEQKAITQILNDLDGEITNLSKELKKRQSIKLGMMQELLTGKTRLV